ncbi:hypothetical protein D9M69_696150 [compost metagenome]
MGNHHGFFHGFEFVEDPMELAPVPVPAFQCAATHVRRNLRTHFHASGEVLALRPDQHHPQFGRAGETIHGSAQSLDHRVAQRVVFRRAVENELKDAVLLVNE